MDVTSINVENDVRRRYNRRVFFCIRIKGAALLIGLWDLLIHSAILCALIFVFGRTFSPMADDYSRQAPDVYPLKSSNTYLNQLFPRQNATRPHFELRTRNFYSHMDFMTIKWAQSLSQQDKCIVFFVVFSSTILILAHIYGILINKASYIVPYFLIKVFNVIISILTMLGFYAYLPDISVWLRMQPNFPFKYYLLELDNQTLQLVLFTFLLFIILAKLYIAAIIWYCYGYITALTMARTIGTITTHSGHAHPITGEMYSPPKYDEAIKSNAQQGEDYAPPPYTPLLSS